MENLYGGVELKGFENKEVPQRIIAKLREQRGWKR